MFVSSFVTFNKIKNIKMCHFCVVSAVEKNLSKLFSSTVCLKAEAWLK